MFLAMENGNENVSGPEGGCVVSDPAVQALERMEASVRYDAREVFFAIWAKHVGVDWDELSLEDQNLIMGRLGYVWYRAVHL